MRLKSILIYSIASAAVALVAPKATPVIDMPSVAQAATNISVSINTFYDDLAPYGSWVSYRDAYVFVPARVSAHWRPYTLGHWVHTRRYGWLWVSSEPFGWATYHYGRWGYADDIGWYWVPGRRWAPAWVAWRRSADHVVWAPLPPDYIDVSVEIRFEDIPDVYWVAVPSRDFLDADLSVVVINDDRERVRFVQAAEPVGNVTIVNNVVVNNVIDVDYVEKTTEKKVETVQVKQTNDPKQVGQGSEGQVAVFSGDVKEEKNAKPLEVKGIEEIKKQKAETGETPQGTTQGQEQPIKKKKATGTEQPSQEQQAQPEEGQGQPLKKKKQKATGTEQPSQQQQAQPEEGQGQPLKKKKQKATGTEQPSQEQQAQPEEGQGQPLKKKKQKATGTEQPSQEQQAQPEEGQGEMIKKKQKSKAYGQPPEPQGGVQPEQGQEQPVQKKKKKGSEPTQGAQPQGCDPSTGQNC